MEVIIIINYINIEEDYEMVKKLNELLPGEKGVIESVEGRGVIRRRCLDMGIVPGTTVEFKKLAPLGDPMEIKVKGFNLAIRKNEAAFIAVKVK